MKIIFVKFILLSNALVLFGDAQLHEIQKELKKLATLRQKIQNEIAKNKKLLAKIEQEKKDLKDLNASINKQIKQIRSERFKKLAKDFENMDPEYAGEKLSKMNDPKIAAYILYNMNPRKAGEALNYVDPVMVSRITTILTKLKKNGKN